MPSETISTLFFVEGIESCADFLDTLAIHAEIGIADSGCLTHVDQLLPVVQEKFHVIDKAKEGGGKFYVEISGILHVKRLVRI